MGTNAFYISNRMKGIKCTLIIYEYMKKADPCSFKKISDSLKLKVVIKNFCSIQKKDLPHESSTFVRILEYFLLQG